VFDCASLNQHPVEPRWAIERWGEDPDTTGIFGRVLFARETPYVVHMNVLDSNAVDGFAAMGCLQKNAGPFPFLATIVSDFYVLQRPKAHVSQQDGR
jgi:hypothetical protein